MMNNNTGGVNYAEVVKDNTDERTLSATNNNNTNANNENVSYFKVLYSNDSAVEKSKKVALLTKQNLQTVLLTIRPWREFFDKNSFGSPAGATEILGRLSRNINYFYSNYIILSLICSLYVLLTNLLFSICCLFVLVSFIFIKSKSAADLEHHMEHNTTTDNLPPVLQIMGKSFTSTQCYTFLCIFAVVTFFLFSGSSVVFWLAVTSVGVSALHATFRRPVPESENVLYQYA